MNGLGLTVFFDLIVDVLIDGEIGGIGWGVKKEKTYQKDQNHN